MNKSGWIIVLISILLLASCSPTAPEPTSTELPQATSTSTPAPEPTREVYSSIPYVEGEGILIRQSLDIYLPETDDGPYPVILAFHGGGFRARSNKLYAEPSKVFNEMGYAVVAANYRFAPSNTFPSQLEDAVCALSWLHANGAEYGLNPSQTILMGDSAGGYLAAMLATHDNLENFAGNCPSPLPESDFYQSAVLFYSSFDWTDRSLINDEDLERSLEPMWGTSYEELSQQQLEDLSPIYWLDGSEKPMLVIHGLEDEVITVEQSIAFADAADDLGIQIELFLPKLAHAFLLLPIDDERVQEAYSRVEAFLNSVFQ